MVDNLISSFSIAFEAVLENKVRSMLTALGIIFGVSAVIAMLAIGNGAEQEILEQIKLVGVNNIVISPVFEQEEEEVSPLDNRTEDKNFSTGLTLDDAQSIKKIISGIDKISPEILIETQIIKNGLRRSAKLVGVENSYFDISNFELLNGKLFNQRQLKMGEAVCVIGMGIKSKFFSTEDPIGKSVKVGGHWLTVIGVLKERYISEKSISNLGIRDYNMDVYAPLQTLLIRYKNRALITQAMIKRANNQNRRSSAGAEVSQAVNYHQLDRLVIQVKRTEQMEAISEVISRLLMRKHFNTVDYEITIPEVLLKQQQRTKKIFNLVLGAIAGISLLVGGIGIMNIMLASVLERIKEIGLRLAIGASKTEIVYQFVFEAVIISVTGGVIGIILGIILAYVVSEVAEINTIVSFSSIILSFGVAATVGLVFGIAPAKRAAEQDPISSLRHE